MAFAAIGRDLTGGCARDHKSLRTSHLRRVQQEVDRKCIGSV
jgi:hypothetical protein